MDAALLNSARVYVAERANAGTICVSPIGLAESLKTDEKTAIDLLSLLQHSEHLVRLCGFVYCTSCSTGRVLEGSTLDALSQSARTLAGTPCECCNTAFPARRELQVRLSFFCNPVARAAGGAEPKHFPSGATSTALTLDDLEALRDRVGTTMITAGAGATVYYGSRVGDEVGGSKAGGNLASGGRDAQVGPAPEEDPSKAKRSVWTSPGFWTAVVSTIGAIVVALIKLPRDPGPQLPSASTSSPPSTLPAAGNKGGTP